MLPQLLEASRLAAGDSLLFFKVSPNLVHLHVLQEMYVRIIRENVLSSDGIIFMACAA